MLLHSRSVLVGLICSGAVTAQHPALGDTAPAIVANSWLNWEGDAPTLESLENRVVLLEFWGTWCGPCVRAMPGIQKLHDRYHERGLTVLAISYEPPETMRPFLTKNAFTMPVGSDPEKKTIAAYGIRGWPTTIVIDSKGKVAHIGSPYDAEAAVEKALGLEAGPAALLDDYLESLKNPDKVAQREALQRLVEKATPDFDLQAWAKSHHAPEVVAEEGVPVPVTTTTKPSGKPANAAELLRRCVQSWASNQDQCTKLLLQLSDAAPTEFDLAAFAQDSFAKAFPLDATELKSLLAEKKYAVVVEAIAQRAPTAPVLASATKHADLAKFCKSKSTETRALAKQGIMAQHWVFSNALPKDEEVNKKFFGELSVSGFALSPDKKSITGMLFGGESVSREQVDGFIKNQLTQTILMEDLGAGKPPRMREMAKLLEQERKAIVRDLEGRYGKPEVREQK